MTFIHWYEGRNYPEQRKATDTQEGQGMTKNKPLGLSWITDNLIAEAREHPRRGYRWVIRNSNTGATCHIGDYAYFTTGEALLAANKFYWRNLAPTESHENGANNDLSEQSAPTTPDTSPARVIDVLAFAYGIVPDATNWDFLLAVAPANIADVLRVELYEQLGDGARDVEARVEAMRKVLNR